MNTYYGMDKIMLWMLKRWKWKIIDSISYLGSVNTKLFTFDWMPTTDVADFEFCDRFCEFHSLSGWQRNWLMWLPLYRGVPTERCLHAMGTSIAIERNNLKLLHSGNIYPLRFFVILMQWLFIQDLTCLIFPLRWACFPIKIGQNAQWEHLFSMYFNDFWIFCLIFFKSKSAFSMVKVSLNGNTI